VVTDRRELFVEQIRRHNPGLSAEVAGALAAVPREAFVTGGFHRRDGSWSRPGDADFLDLVHRDDVLVTKLADGVPVSSSSQPSLMAIMIEALAVRPGLRILEIGAGTGYNAALLSALGASVTSVDVQPDVAAQARAALARAGVERVDVRDGDGYEGAPGEAADRVVVTVGVAGISPRWLEQLTGDGPIVAPVEHAGTHPVLAVRSDLTARVVCSSGFMSAAGRLTERGPDAHPGSVPSKVLTKLSQVAPPRWDGPLDGARYRDLEYAAGVWHRRATHAALPGRDQSAVLLLDGAGTGGAAILPDGSVRAGGDEARRYAAEAVELLDRWVAAGHPAMEAWTVTLAPAGPIYVPARWELTTGP
jgi:protein-L-isoaspartate(D-aspartate) O-methyltransferase